jgi:5'-deoxynucleotidase YfbR-like HD superfamily hydrolase
MLSGRRLDLLDPSPLDIEIEDIAHGLARVARWNGQTKGAHPYSVAQHSLLVEAIALRLDPGLDRQAALCVLLHDAAEYVIGDIISPFKAVLGDGYRGVEERILDAVMMRFGLNGGLRIAARKLAKRADTIAAYHEATQLAGFTADEAALYFGRPERLPQAILALLEPWTTQDAQSAYLQRFTALSGAPQERG